MSDNGWINAELFTEWGHCFLKSLPKDDPQPHLLLVDGHSSHVYNIDFLNLMKDNNVYVFSLPPHTTHYLQPADRALFKSLKHFWRLEGRRVTRESAGKRLDRALFMPLFSKAWSKAATPENAQAGFRRSGIHPFNPDKIDKSLFMPSQTTETVFDHACPTQEHDDDSFQVIPGHTPRHPLHDAVQPEIPLPQLAPQPSPQPAQPPPQLAIVTPPPLAQEVEVATEPDLSFMSLVTLPVRERPSSSRQRAKPPSYNLTSQEHFNFVKQKKEKSKAKKTPKHSKMHQVHQDACKVCGFLYGDTNDPKLREEWVSCEVCWNWYHGSCAEESGIIEDNKAFTCTSCLFPEM
ncbi:hypothetical protein ACEWY4_001172 [Coilia grayii]|uniref:Zinc finger PHD-type domain-containing protein n=1 Tax=Coilia grayii TaxID=363190 RepID=A0ABD1KYQ8_9TELE